MLQKLRVLTLNIFVRPYINNFGSDYKTQRLDYFVDHFANNYDVIGFQELFDSSHRRRFLKKLDYLGFTFQHASSNNTYVNARGKRIKLIDAGLCIVSRFPIVDNDHIVYKNDSLWTIDCVVGKGALYAKIRVPITSDNYHGVKSPTLDIHVFNTHMQSCDSKDHGYHRIRINQVNELSNFVSCNANTDRPLPTILLGDFNIDGRCKPDNSTVEISGVNIESVQPISCSSYYSDLMAALEKGCADHTFIDLLSQFNNNDQLSTGGPNHSIMLSEDRPLDIITRLKDKRLDYLFLSNACSHPFTLQPISCQLNHFATTDHNHKLPNAYTAIYPFKRISDHSGIESTFEIVTN